MNGSGVLLADGSHEFLKRLVGRIPVQRLAGPVVHQVGNGIERILVVHAQVGALGQELAQQAVGVLAAALLPRAVRVAEVHPHASRSGELLVPGHLLALVIGERLTHGLGHLAQLVGERRQRTLG